MLSTMDAYYAHVKSHRSFSSWLDMGLDNDIL